MGFKAVIFDLDGTLLNTLDDLAVSANNALEKLGFPTHDIEAYKYFVGSGIRVLIKRALPQSVAEDESIVDRCLEEMQGQYNAHWDDKTVPYEGIPELLNALSSHGIKMSILSNKPDNFTQLTVNKLLSGWKFEVVLGKLEGVPPKPDPSSALKISRQLGLSPAEFVFLGDSGIDMRTANAAGMYAVGAAWGFRTVEELKNSGAKKIIYRPGELLDIVL